MKRTSLIFCALCLGLFSCRSTWGQASFLDEHAQKPAPPRLSSPTDPETKKPAPADYSGTSSDKTPSDKLATDRTADTPAEAETNEKGGAAADAGDDPAALKRLVATLHRRLETLETQVGQLKTQIRDDANSNLELHQKTAGTIKSVSDGVTMMNAHVASLTEDLKKMRTEMAASGEEQKRLARVLDDAQKSMLQLTDEMKTVRADLNKVGLDLDDANRGLQDALSQVARWDEKTGRWVRLRESARTSAGATTPREELAPVTQGKLVIINHDPAAERVIYVNGTPWRARVGRSFIWVPLGDVAIATPGNDPKFLRAWKSNAASGQMELKYEF